VDGGKPSLTVSFIRADEKIPEGVIRISYEIRHHENRWRRAEPSITGELAKEAFPNINSLSSSATPYTPCELFFTVVKKTIQDVNPFRCFLDKIALNYSNL
jgi:hypothetical protein